MEPPPAKRRRIIGRRSFGHRIRERISADHENGSTQHVTNRSFDSLSPLTQQQVIAALACLDCEECNHDFQRFQELQNREDLDLADIDISEAVQRYKWIKHNPPPTLDDVPEQLIIDIKQSILDAKIEDFTMDDEEQHLNDPRKKKKFVYIHIFSFLDGSDLAAFDVAFGSLRKQNVPNLRSFIEKVSRSIYLSNSKIQQKTPFTIDRTKPFNNDRNRLIFPAARSKYQWSYKLLYQLHLCAPSVSLLGGIRFRRGGMNVLEPETKWYFFNHRKYTIEKALAGGGLAMIDNVFRKLNLTDLKQQWMRNRHASVHMLNSATPNFEEDLCNIGIYYPLRLRRKMKRQTVKYLKTFNDIKDVIDFDSI